MENYTITKEQILELSNSSIVIKEKLNEMFPDAFKKELELNKWYIPETEKGSLWFIKYVLGNGKGYGYGFINGNYKECQNILINDSRFKWREATHQEIETALIAEAKKRGFIEGAKFKDARYGKNLYKVSNESIFRLYDNEILCIENCGNGTVFYKGNWAEIIPEETKVITMDKAVKILSKKYGKQVEIK